MLSLRSVATVAFVFTAIYLMLGSAYYLRWHYYTVHPVIPPLDSRIIEDIRSLNDAESLREVALHLSRERQMDSELFELQQTEAMALTSLVAIGAAMSFALLGWFVLRVRSANVPGDA